MKVSVTALNTALWSTRFGCLGLFVWTCFCAGPAVAQRPASEPADPILPGLAATYRDAGHEVRLVVPTANFYLEPEESLHPSIAASFEAEWIGLLSVLRAGSYSLRASSAEIHLQGTRHDQPVRLTPGRYPIRLIYRRPRGVARLRLTWQADHFPEEPIPSSAFFHRHSQQPDPESKLAEKGRELFEEFGCANCHYSDSPTLQPRPGPDLSHLASRVQEAWILHWLKDPQAFRAGALMPVMLDAEQRRDVARYLASLEDPSAKRKSRRANSVQVYEGHDLYTSVGCTACHEQQGLTLAGAASKWQLPALAAYLRDPSSVDRSGRMPAMLDEDEALRIAAHLMNKCKTTGAGNPKFERPWEGGDPANGKRLVESQGCLACHALRNPAPLVNRHRTLPLNQLKPEQGCLENRPASHVPLFPLTGEQRQALRTFLCSYRERPDRSPAPIHALGRELRRHGCVNCHQMDHLGPLASLAESAPVLTDVGSKLKTQRLQAVLSDGKRAHDPFALRMPDFGSANTLALAEAFAKTAGVPPGDGEAPPQATEALRSRGHGLLGTNPEKSGMGCIGCHDWGETKSLGEEGPQLVDAADRLRYDWYFRWMRDPSRILSGTSMPNYFSSSPPAQAEQTINALWAALEKSHELPAPDGFDLQASLPGSEDRPEPKDRPVVVRVDMPEASPAPIAVGIPGGISYCFDTVVCRLLYAWRGEFLDTSPTVLRKTEPGTKRSSVATILGEIFYRSDNLPLRVGTFDRLPDRDYRGYRLVEGHPEFHYRLDGIDVYQRIVAEPANKGFVREFRIPRVTQPWWFLVEEPEGVEVTSSLGASRDSLLEIPQGTDVEFTVTVRIQGLDR